MRKVLSPEGVPTQIVRSPDVVCPIVRKTDDIAEIVRHPDDLCRAPHGYPAGKRHGWHDYVRAGESVVFRRVAAPSREELEVLVQRLGLRSRVGPILRQRLLKNGVLKNTIRWRRVRPGNPA